MKMSRKRKGHIKMCITLIGIISLIIAAFNIGPCRPKIFGYYVSEELDISLSTKYQGRYEFILPMLQPRVDEEGVDEAHSFNKLKIIKGDGEFTISLLNWTHVIMGSANGTIKLEGEYYSDQKYIQDTEGYVFRHWGPTEWDERHDAIRTGNNDNVIVKVSNETTDKLIEVNIHFKGESDNCYRENHLHGKIGFSGIWTELEGRTNRGGCI